MDEKIFVINNLSAQMLDQKPFLFELAMEEYLIEHPDIFFLSSELSKPTIAGYEVAKKGKRYDMIVRYDDSDTTAIFEAKKGVLDSNAIKQVRDYMEQYGEYMETDSLIGGLIGSSIDSQTITKIEKSKDLFAIVIKRYDANDKECIHTQIYSPRTKFVKDYKKYKLTDANGTVYKELGKGRLVYQIIKSYLETTPCTITQLQKVFPNSLMMKNKSMYDLVRVNDLKPDNKEYSRYFHEPLQCVDGEVLICSQWGIGNIGEIITYAKDKLNMDVK